MISFGLVVVIESVMLVTPQFPTELPVSYVMSGGMICSKIAPDSKNTSFASVYVIPIVVVD